MPVVTDMPESTNRRDSPRAQGFTLLEVVVVLVLVGLSALFGTQMLTSVARGYILARSSDAVVQKAQIALQRMTNEFSYITAVSSSASSSITYTANFNDSESHTIALSGNAITYTVSGTPYVLTDSVATNGLNFTYFNNYNATGESSFTSGSTKIIGISLTMHGADWDSGVTKNFTTRVTVSKFRQ